jgi:hypothetical protein
MIVEVNDDATDKQEFKEMEVIRSKILWTTEDSLLDAE